MWNILNTNHIKVYFVVNANSPHKAFWQIVTDLQKLRLINFAFFCVFLFVTNYCDASTKKLSLKGLKIEIPIPIVIPVNVIINLVERIDLMKEL